MAAQSESIWYPKEYLAEQERKRAMAQHPNAPTPAVRYYPSNEAIREVVEAQRRLAKLNVSAANDKAPRAPQPQPQPQQPQPRPQPQLQPTRAHVPALVRAESSATSSSPSSIATEIVRVDDWMKETRKRTSTERMKPAVAASDDEVGSRRRVIAEEPGFTISVQDRIILPAGAAARAPAANTSSSRRALDVVPEASEPVMRSAPAPRGVPVPTRQAGASLPPISRESAPAISRSLPSSVLATDGSASTRSARSTDPPPPRKLVRQRTVSDGATKLSETLNPNNTWPAGSSTHKPPPLSEGRNTLPVVQAPPPSGYDGGPPLRRTVSARSAQEVDKRRAPNPAPASAWRTLHPEDAARARRGLRFDSIPEEEAPSARTTQARRTSFESASSSASHRPLVTEEPAGFLIVGAQAPAPAPRRSSLDSASSSALQRAQFLAAHQRSVSANNPMPSVPPLSRVVSEPMPPVVSRPRPPAHVQALLRRPNKTLSRASMDVQTGADSDDDIVDFESTRSSVYSLIPPARDPKVGVHMWRQNDERQLRTQGKRTKPGVTFDFPEERMPSHTKLTEQSVDMLPDAVRTRNER